MYCTLSLKDLSSHILLVAHSWTRKLRISSRHCFKVKASLYYVSSICCKTTQRTEAATPTRACQLVKGGMPLSGAQRAAPHSDHYSYFSPWTFIGTPPQVDVEGECEDTTNVDSGIQTTQTFHLPASVPGVSRLSFYLRLVWRSRCVSMERTMADAVSEMSVQLASPRGVLPWRWVYTPLLSESSCTYTADHWLAHSLALLC